MTELINNTVDKIFKSENIAGMCVAVTDREKIIYKSGFGVASTEIPEVPIHPDALFRVASVTKMVTGFTISKLAEDGLLSLDVPVCEYVPWLKLPKNAEKVITVRMLLSHTAGLPVEYNPDGPREESALENSLMEELENVDMEFFPGDNQYLYSNLGIRLASYIAQLRAGKEYSELARECILNPLGMKYSTFDLRVAATYPLSLPHDEVNSKLVPQHYIKENSARLAAGGLYSNTEDLSKLARFILRRGKSDSGDVILKESTIDEHLKPLTMLRNGNKDGYGLTITINHYDGGVMHGHLGNASPYGASVFVDFKKDIGVVTLMNTFRSDVRTLVPEQILSLFSAKD